MINARVFAHLNQGDFWTMGSALSWAVYCAFLRIKPREVKGNAFVAVSALLGAIVLIPVLALELIRNGMPGWNSYANTGVVTGLAYLVIFPSWLSYLLWNKGISAIGATRGEIYSHLIPLSGGLFSVMFLHVALHSYHLVSALVIMCGIALCSRPSAKKRLAAARGVKSG